MHGKSIFKGMDHILRALEKGFATPEASERESGTENEIVEIVRRWAMIFNAAPIGIAIANPEGYFLEVNSHFHKMLEYTETDIKQLTFVDITYPVDRELTQILADEVRQGKREFYEVEKRYIKKSGEPVWSSTRAAAVRDAGEKVKYWIGLMNDITDRKRAEEELKDSEERFRTLYEGSSQGILLGDKEGKILDANPMFLKTLGYDIEDLRGKNGPDLIHPDDLKETPFKLNDVQEKKTVRIERRIRKKNGAYIMCDVSSRLVADNLVQIHFRDISKLKEAEEALRDSEDRFRTLVEYAPDGILLYDADGGRFIEANGNLMGLLGFTREEFLKKDWRDISSPMQPGGYSSEEKGRALENRVLSGEVISDEWVFVTAEGREMLTELRLTRLPSRERNIIRASIVDITEKRKLEEHFQQTQKLESIGVLAGGIAHDFNNFLAGITGNLSLIKLDIDPADEIFPRLEAMEKAALRAANLTQQLLTFSKGGEPVKRPVDLKNLVKESSLFSLRGSNVRCEFDFPSESLLSTVDDNQISQSIQNLVLNADQAMPDGGVVRIRGEKIDFSPNNSLSIDAGEYVKLTIKDVGVGIKKEHLEKVFDPYFTTKQKGSGLGLSVAYSIISKHNGRIAVESELGIGTTFSIYLPAIDEVEPELEKKKKVITKGVGKILVMDDEDIIRELASHMLERMGYTVTLAKDGQEAVELYKQALTSSQPYDAVILDLTVPGGLGGKETIQKLLKIDENVNAIVSSGYSNDPVMSNYGLYGFKHAVKKPYLIEDIGQALQSVLD